MSVTVCYGHIFQICPPRSWYIKTFATRNGRVICNTLACFRQSHLYNNILGVCMCLGKSLFITVYDNDTVTEQVLL